MFHFRSIDPLSPPLQNSSFFFILFILTLYTSTLTAQSNFNISGKSISILNGQVSTSTTDNTDFSSQAVCAGMLSHDFVISNSGSSVLTIGSLTSTDAAFSFGNIPTSINPGQNAVLTIYFDPSSIGVVNSTITIVNNDAGQDPFSFAVVGSGVAPQADIVRGNALQLDGVDDYISCGTSLNSFIDNHTEFTVEAWINIQDVQDEQVVLSNTASGNTEGVEMRIDNGTIWLSYRDNNNSLYSSPAVAISNNEWYHVAGIINSDSIGIYLNGIFAHNSISATGISPSSNPVIIGANNSLGSYNLQGKIDEVRLWNKCRNAQQIRESIHLSLHGCETGLLAYYQCNASSGTLLENKLGNGHDGSLNNGLSWTVSDINLGNDIGQSSAAQTISVPQGTSSQTFSQANVSMNVVRNNMLQDITVSYQTFAPNNTAGSVGFSNFDNYIWTINSASDQDLIADYTFHFPSNTFSYLTASKYALYWRSMNAGSNWSKIAVATAVTDSTLRFGKIGAIGQFMVVQESADRVTEVRGEMIEMDGIDDFINAGNNASLDLVENYTIECWFKTNVISGSEKVLMSKELSMFDEGFVLSVVNNDIQFYFPNMGQLSYTGIVQNQWHHVAATFSYGNISLYLDGVEVASGYMEFVNNTTQDFYIGASHLYNGGGSANYFVGAIDEVRIWSSTRTQAEIRENMHLTLRGTESDLISYYQFNGDLSAGTVGGIQDAMNQNNATSNGLTNAAYITSEVPAGGGRSDRITIAATGPIGYTLNNTAVDLNFGGTAADGEIVVYRIESEKPHGWNSIAGDVDNEYFIVENFGNNSNFTNLTNLSFNRLGYISEDDVALAQSSSPLLLYKRGDNDYGATWGNSKGGAASATAGSCGSVSYDSNNNLSSFSQFVVVNVNNNSLLPTELIAFDAARKEQHVVDLNWQIADNKQIQYFDIEWMQPNATTFKKVGRLHNNNSNDVALDYNFNHANSQRAVSYYRLKIVDTDGAFFYSPVKAVEGLQKTGSEQAISLFPSPVKHQLNISLEGLEPGTETRIKIVDMNGMIVREQIQMPTSYSLLQIDQLESLQSAVYLIMIQTQDQLYSRKFIKS